MIKLTIPGNPIPKHRPRFRRSGKAYSDQTAQMDVFREYAALQYTQNPLETALSVKIEYFMVRPKAHYGKGQNIARILKSALHKNRHPVRTLTI